MRFDYWLLHSAGQGWRRLFTYEQPLYERSGHERHETVKYDPHVYVRQYGEQKRGRYSASRGKDTAFGVSGIHAQAHGQTETHRGEQSVVNPRRIRIVIGQPFGPKVVEYHDRTHNQGGEDIFQAGRKFHLAFYCSRASNFPRRASAEAMPT